jgi:DNA-binding CsgD family transcriptional regulator
MLGVGYFVSYLNAGGASFGDFAFASSGSLWLDFVVRGSVCLLVFFLGRRIKISQLIYATVFAYVLALLMLMLKLEAEAIAFIAIDIAFILAQIAFYVLFTALVYKFGGRPAILGFLSLCVGLGVVGGQGAGRSLSSVLAKYPTHLLVISLILANTCFFVLSFLLRSTMREIDLEREKSPGLYRPPSAKSGQASGESSGESSSIALRRDIAKALLALNERFDQQYRLTKRELQVAAYCVERYDYETIAEKMGITLNTLKTHAKNIYQKYDIRGRKDLAELLENSMSPKRKP